MAPHITELKEILKDKTPAESLKIISSHFLGTAVFSTSFGLEDQAVTHLIFTAQLPIEVFTLDTGRFFPETYSTWSRTTDIYKQPIKAYYPHAADIENFVSQHGPNAFYESVQNRKLCCHIRKVAPLQRALKSKKIWITGLRAEQSPERRQTDQLEWDEANNILKFHPILFWNWGELNNFVKQNAVPYNVLHDKGFVSIGCAPCTRAIKPGEDFRAGRWWWEDSSKRECDLHVHEVKRR